MAGRDHEDEQGMPAPEADKRLEQEFLLPPVGTAGDPHRLPAGQAHQAAPELLGPGLVGDGVDFQISGHDDPLRRGAERDDPAGVLGRLHGEHRDPRQDAPHEGAHEPVAAEGAIRDPPVGDHRGDAPPLEAPEEVRPDLGLDGDEESGLHAGESPRHRAWKIEREVAVRHHRLDPVLDDPRSRRGHRGDHRVDLRPAPPHGVDQRDRRHHLPHRHRVDPAARLGREPRRPVAQALEQSHLRALRDEAPHDEHGRVQQHEEAQETRVEEVHVRSP
jgi:hypothetical protein